MNNKKSHSFNITCVSLLILIFILMPFNKESYGTVIDDYRHYVSVRSFFESYGAKVAWDNENREGIIEFETFVIKIPIQSSTIFINNDAIFVGKTTQLIDQKLLIAPSSLIIIIGEINPNNISHSTDQLWNNTVAIHIKDKLWLDESIYDAGHYLMVPMHAAFMLDNIAWQQQFSDHFIEFMKNKHEISKGRLNQVHYYYLLSRFIVLASEADKNELIPDGMADYLYSRIINLFYNEPAWQWGHSDFSCVKERIIWKLTTLDPKQSYYRAIIDEELFLFAIAADLSNYYRDKNNEKTQRLNDILNVAHRVFKQEIKLERDGWLFQPGVWAQHPDYAYAGNENKALDLEKKLVNDISMDTNHSHRFPLWLTSLAEAYPPGSDMRKYYYLLRNNLAEQFVSKVLIEPTVDFPAYRTTNFMDGRNGIYRWNYATQGNNNGYGPYELSGTLMLGWWIFLENPKTNNLYKEMSKKFPLSDDVIKLYYGPETIRDRHYLITGSNQFVNGYIELINVLASEINKD